MLPAACLSLWRVPSSKPCLLFIVHHIVTTCNHMMITWIHVYLKLETQRTVRSACTGVVNACTQTHAHTHEHTQQHIYTHTQTHTPSIASPCCLGEADPVCCCNSAGGICTPTTVISSSSPATAARSESCCSCCCCCCCCNRCSCCSCCCCCCCWCSMSCCCWCWCCCWCCWCGCWCCQLLLAILDTCTASVTT